MLAAAKHRSARLHHDPALRFPASTRLPIATARVTSRRIDPLFMAGARSCPGLLFGPRPQTGLLFWAPTQTGLSLGAPPYWPGVENLESLWPALRPSVARCARWAAFAFVLRLRSRARPAVARPRADRRSATEFIDS
jgi:hypothetical protein